MSKFLRSLSALLLVCCMPVMAQQLPDSGFEDWSGAQFDGKEQPKHWNFSNVSQLGVNKNFAHKSTGRTGSSALKIQDQFVGFGSIGATSPGYVSLGHPWAYLSDLSSINDATAGTYGGINWRYRPDSMVVWIKRYYDSSVDQAAGDHIADENFHLLYYAWSGTSKGETYKAKDLSCTNVANTSYSYYCVDEESDIRQALDGNECGTKEFAKQIAEGWFYQKKRYDNWTRIVIPIYYMSDDVPTKCNVILSAGRYPDFRANSGQYAGSTMEVDDIQLIYSSKAQKIYVGGREWKGFDPNNTGEQVYSLGVGATTIPEVSAVRGAGVLTNTRGGRATFQGRRLSDSECRITYGQVDGTPTLVTITSEDGSSTTTYRIKFVSQASNNARLSDIQVNGETVSGFNAYLTSYDVALPYGTTSAPVVTATPQDGTATYVITQATSPTGTAKIEVTAGDGKTKQTYTLSFSVAALTDVTLKNIFLDGVALTGFLPNKSNYTVSLPLGTTTAPAITWASAYPAGVQTVTVLNNTLEGGAQIQVTLPNSTLSKTYKLTYKIEASSYSYLGAILLDGDTLADFVPEQTIYTITLPMGTTTLPAITWTKGDPYQEVTMTEGGVDGTTRIEVTAASGATTTYRLQFRTEKSSNNALTAILLDGEPIAEFDSETLAYDVLLPAGTTSLPTISWTAGDAYQTVAVTINQALLMARVTVTAGDGSTRQYILRFEIQKSENAFLQMIYLDGNALEGFEPSTLDYTITWSTATMPKITVLPNEDQAVTIAATASYGTARIVVTPDEGTPNTYLLHFVSPDQVTIPAFPTDAFPASNDASLAGLYIGGQAYDAFNPMQYDYTYPLPRRTLQVPAVVPVAGAKGQTITVMHGQAGYSTTIHVVAADGTTAQDYRIAFPMEKSSNTSLLAVEIDGVNFTFDPAQHTYTGIQLPYGTTVSPTLTVERAEPEQALVITEAPIGKPSSIVVTAEDGTKATYTFSYQVELPVKANELLGIVLDGIGALDMTQAPNFTIDLPYGASPLKVVSVAKNYPEQRVSIVEGGLNSPTVITVKSRIPTEEDAVYTLTPNVYPYDPAQLLDIQVDGVSISQFSPDGYSYVLSVNSTPDVTFTAQEGADVDIETTEKWVRLTVEAEEGAYKHSYMINFFYPNDFTFDMTFDQFDYVTNNHIDESAYCPQGWNAPIRANTENKASPNTYYPSSSQSRTTEHTQGSYAAVLKTAFLTTSAESMPGVFSLSSQAVYIGRWYLGISGVSSSSNLSFGEPILFRNSPDKVYLDYNTRSSKKITKWSFLYMINGEPHKYEGDFSANNSWQTMELPITYDEDFVPSALDIRINSGDYETPGAYNVNSIISSNGYQSEMWVDNMRFSYDSKLNGLKVNGTAATMSGNAFTVTIDADYVGIPKLEFDQPVVDQMPVVSWKSETGGSRSATIRNYAEDLSSTTYTLKVKRPKSTNTSCTWVMEGMDLTVTKGSPYQKIKITENDTAYIITVTAENGARKIYYAAWNTTGAGAAQVTYVPAEIGITGSSTARLMNLLTEPVLNYEREYALDSVVMTMTDAAYALHVIGETSDTTYLIDRAVSSNALLESMTTNNISVPDFYSETYDYSVSLASLDAFAATPQDPEAEVRYVIQPINAEYSAIYVLVTAADGVTQKHYTVLANIRPLASEAYLTSIESNEVLLSGFASDQYDYTIHLPAHSAIPTLSSVACAGAKVVSTTTQMGSSVAVTFTVTSEDGETTRVYTVNVQVDPSEVCTLSDLIINNASLEGFSPTQTNYSIELPAGTTTLPDVAYILTDKTSTASVTKDENSITVTVTAEDGVHQTVYTVLVTYAKSTNAALQAIYVNGSPLATFFADEHHYDINLPFGVAIPTVTAEAADPKATVVVSPDNTTITVTAEDGVTTATYTITFNYLPSTNANLLSIELDGKQQKGFAPDTYEYKDTVFFGSPMPIVTWTVGDEQQVVDTTWVGDTELTIAVTAGDGITTAEYILSFAHMLSNNCRLADLQVRGTTIEGFDPDSVEYTIEYPIGSTEALFFAQSDVTAVPEDKDATYTVTMDENASAQILVTAPDGSRRVYVINQKILHSSEARLKMIWLEGVEVRDFEMDTLHYTIVLQQGAIMPLITAEPLDSLATWDLGMPTETEDGYVVQIYCIAEDETTALTYTLNFRYANWTANSEPDKDDYLFFPIGGGQYKAVTISIGIQFAIYDMAGRLVLFQTLPTADPADVEVEVQADGNQILHSALPSADGVVFDAKPGQPYFYVFFDTKTKRIEKGGKFEWK